MYMIYNYCWKIN